MICFTNIEDECTYIALNAIKIPTVTKSAQQTQQPRGQGRPSHIEEEPKEPGTSRENDRDSTPTKAIGTSTAHRTRENEYNQGSRRGDTLCLHDQRREFITTSR